MGDNEVWRSRHIHVTPAHHSTCFPGRKGALFSWRPSHRAGAPVPWQCLQERAWENRGDSTKQQWEREMDPHWAQPPRFQGPFVPAALPEPAEHPWKPREGGKADRWGLCSQRERPGLGEVPLSVKWGQQNPPRSLLQAREPVSSTLLGSGTDWGWHTVRLSTREL